MNFKIYIMVVALFGIGVVALRYSVGPELRRLVDGRLFACFAGLTFLGAISSNSLVFVIICAAVLIYASRNALDAVCLYILFVAFLPGVSALLKIGGIYLTNISLTAVLTIACMIAIAIKGERRRDAPPRGLSVEDVVIVLLYVALVFGAQRFGNPTGLLRAGFGGLLSIAFPYILFRQQVRSTAELRMVIAAFGISACVLSLYAIYEAQTGWTMFSGLRSGMSDGRRHGNSTRGGAVRAVATMSGPLALGSYLAMGWIATAASRPLFRTRILWLCWLFVIALGLFFTQSRGNLAGLAAAGIVLLAINRRVGLAAIGASGAAVGWLSLNVIASFSPKIASLINPAGATEGDAYDYRNLLLQRGLEEGAKSRWTGASMRSVLSRLEDLRQGEGIIDLVNNYLTIYLVSGLVGLIPIVLCFGSVLVKNVMALLERTSAELKMMISFTTVSAGLFLFQMSFTSFSERGHFAMGLILASSRLNTAARFRELRLAAKQRADRSSTADGPRAERSSGPSPS